MVGAIFNSLDKDIPRNAGSFRRLSFQYAENSVVASPVFPHSCSTATTNVSERLVNITQSAFARLGEGHGLAEGARGSAPAWPCSPARITGATTRATSTA